ncbi:MAG: tetratricopeptide repeat protein [Clostridiales bacterium]|nr:tetratricopeptide repeat protein [Clostridiales bacterium]
MGFFANLKAKQAYNLHGKGQWTEARELYEQAIAQGMNNPRYLLSYTILLIRLGEYQKAKDHLVKLQKHPALTAEQKVQLFMDYAVCCYKMDDLERGVHLLESQHKRQPTGMVFETLGYLYVEKFSPERKPVADVTIPEAQEGEEAPAAKTQEELDAEWEAGKEAALAFLKEAVEYDEEDAVCLDNMGQFLYRVLGDKAAAKEWFDKAIAVKEGQIDTLWFLSRYDLENGDTAGAIEKLEKSLEGRFSPLNFKAKAEVEAEIQRLKK